MDELSQVVELYSNLYKDRFGVRPRAKLAFAAHYGWTVQDWEDEIKKLEQTFDPFDEHMEPETKVVFNIICGQTAIDKANTRDEADKLCSAYSKKYPNAFFSVQETTRG